MDFDKQVKLLIYETVAQTTKIPTVDHLAAKLLVNNSKVIAALKELAAKRLIVLEPASNSRIRMAPPFSAIETSYKVVIGKKLYFANCAWDAFGISAALKSDAVIEAECVHCHHPLIFNIRDNNPMPNKYIIHFAVPAAQWWQDIIYT